MSETVDLRESAAAELAMLCDAWGVTPAAVHPRSREPLGAGMIAGFDVTEGEQAVTVYVDTSGTDVTVETGMSKEGVGRVWMHPADPHLPALAAVSFADSATTLLSRLGVAIEGAPEFVAYRPGRRAVLRVTTAAGPLWVKVVRPRHAPRIVAAHERLRQAGIPVPAVLAWSPDGLLIIEQAPGTPASHSEWTAAGLVDAVEVLREQLDELPAHEPLRSAVLTRVDWYAGQLAAAAPESADRVQRLAERLALTPNSRTTCVHGDLHFGQLFLDESAARVVGVIDVDTLGSGDRSEDAAAFLAHSIASCELAEGPARTRLQELVSLGASRWGDDPAVRGRVSAHLLGHAAGAWGAGESMRGMRLIEIAEQWAQAPRVANKS